MIKAVEEWRKEMNLKQFILLGHSMGGFLAAAYAIRYPDRVKHLILADPWGFPEKPTEIQKREVPWWVKAIAYTLSPFNPLWAIRAAGPFGIANFLITSKIFLIRIDFYLRSLDN